MATDAAPALRQSASGRRWRLWAYVMTALAIDAAVSFYWATQVDPTFYAATYGGLALLWYTGALLRRDSAGMARSLPVAAVLGSLYFHAVLVPVYFWNRSIVEPNDAGRYLALLTVLSAAWSAVLVAVRRK